MGEGVGEMAGDGAPSDAWSRRLRRFERPQPASWARKGAPLKPGGTALKAHPMAATTREFEIVLPDRGPEQGFGEERK